MIKRFCDKCGRELEERDDYKQISILYKTDNKTTIEEFPDYCNTCANVTFIQFLNFMQVSMPKRSDVFLMQKY